MCNQSVVAVNVQSACDQYVVNVQSMCSQWAVSGQSVCSQCAVSVQSFSAIVAGNYTVNQFEESLTNYLPKKTLNKVLGRLPPELKVEAERSERDKTQSMLIRRLLQDYNDIVMKNIKDTIPKAIQYKMVDVATESMHMRMMGELYKEVSLAASLSVSLHSVLLPLSLPCY